MMGHLLFPELDLLLFAWNREEVVGQILQSTPDLIRKICSAVYVGLLSEDEIDEKLSRLPPLSKKESPEGDEDALKRTLFRASLTLLGEIPTLDRIINQDESIHEIAPGENILIEVTKVTLELLSKIKELQMRDVNIFLALYCSPYALLSLPKVPVVVAFEDNPWTREAVHDFLQGKLFPSGKLPIYVLGKEREYYYGCKNCGRARQI